jgi:acyl-CoA synthetase (AMP-forming)/AMP-acid ligase II
VSHSSSATSLDRPSTLVGLLQYRALHQPERTAYTFLSDGETHEASLTYRVLDCQARSIAAQLQHLNMAGQRALLLYPPGLEFITAFFGCLYAGVVAVPAYLPSPRRPPTRLQAIAADAQAQVILSTAAALSKLAPQLAALPSPVRLSYLPTDTIASTSWPK